MLRLPAQLIEEGRHSDIPNARNEIEDQTQPALSEEDDYSRQYGDQIKEPRNSGLEARRCFCKPFFHFSGAHNCSS